MNVFHKKEENKLYFHLMVAPPFLIPMFPSLAGVVLAAWDFSKVQGPAPPSGRGRLDFLKSPRSNPPLREGQLDFLKSPRSNPPLLEGQLDFLKSARSKGGGVH